MSRILYYGATPSGDTLTMDEQTPSNELDLLTLKNTARKHILYGITLIAILPCCLFLIFYTLLGWYILIIVATPSLGLWFLYDGINGYKSYKKRKKEFEPPELY
jgi:hypothetical protein